MSKPTAKAMRAELAKPKKPKLTQQQVDDANLQKKLAAIPSYYPIDAKRTSKEACVAAANECGARIEVMRQNAAMLEHLLEIERREHKKTKALLRKYQPKVKECPKPKA